MEPAFMRAFLLILGGFITIGSTSRSYEACKTTTIIHARAHHIWIVDAVNGVVLSIEVHDLVKQVVSEIYLVVNRVNGTALRDVNVLRVNRL